MKKKIWFWAHIDLEGRPCLDREKVVSLSEYRKIEQKVKILENQLKRINYERS